MSNERQIEYSYFKEDFPFIKWVDITPNDSTDISKIPRSVYVGGSGNIVAVDAEGNEVTFNSVPVGIFNIQPARIKATDTTATDLIALY